MSFPRDSSHLTSPIGFNRQHPFPVHKSDVLDNHLFLFRRSTYLVSISLFRIIPSAREDLAKTKRIPLIYSAEKRKKEQIFHMGKERLK